MFGSLWGSLTESVSEGWDIVYDAGEAALKDFITSEREEGVDKTSLKSKEPKKGSRADGSPIVVKGSLKGNRTQLINGIDNKIVYAGGGLLFLLVGVAVVKVFK